MHPLVGNGVGDVLHIGDSDELYLYHVAKYEDIGAGFELIRDKYVAVGRLDDQRSACARVINGECDIVRLDFLDRGLALFDELVGIGRAAWTASTSGENNYEG